jgi:hypothetical protein
MERCQPLNMADQGRQADHAPSQRPADFPNSSVKIRLASCPLAVGSRAFEITSINLEPPPRCFLTLVLPVEKNVHQDTRYKPNANALLLCLTTAKIPIRWPQGILSFLSQRHCSTLLLVQCSRVALQCPPTQSFVKDLSCRVISYPLQ